MNHTHSTSSLVYLQGYPDPILDAVSRRLEQNTLGSYLKNKYPKANEIRTDKQLYAYVQDLKNQYMKKESPISKVLFDSQMRDLQGTLGTHTRMSRIHGSKIQRKNEIRVASIFKNAPAEFLRMICVHELAHLREKEHNKAFYQLCLYMETDYAVLELDMRLYLTYLAETKEMGIY